MLPETDWEKQFYENIYIYIFFIREKIPMELFTRKLVFLGFGRILLLRWFLYMRSAWNFDPDLIRTVPGPNNRQKIMFLLKRSGFLQVSFLFFPEWLVIDMVTPDNPPVAAAVLIPSDDQGDD